MKTLAKFGQLCLIKVAELISCGSRWKVCCNLLPREFEGAKYNGIACLQHWLHVYVIDNYIVRAHSIQYEVAERAIPIRIVVAQSTVAQLYCWQRDSIKVDWGLGVSLALIMRYMNPLLLTAFCQGPAYAALCHLSCVYWNFHLASFITHSFCISCISLSPSLSLALVRC